MRPASSTSATTVLLCALALLCAACSSSEPESAAPASTSSAAAPYAGGGAATALRASVGTDAAPDAFEIDLLDASGSQVRELSAGTYTITVDDRSKIHNFAVSGPGGIDEKTSVPEVGEFVLEVELVAGEYGYVCDPHPNMSGSFTVA